MAHRRIGQVLVDMGFITDEQQELLVDEQHEHPGQLLGKVAIDMGPSTRSWPRRWASSSRRRGR